MTATSPMQRSLAYLRERYPLVDVVEKWNPYAKVRKDLWGIADLVCVGDDILAVQTTSGSNLASRVRKVTESAALPVLRKAGIRVVCHGWAKRKGKWTLKEIDVS